MYRIVGHSSSRAKNNSSHMIYNITAVFQQPISLRACKEKIIENKTIKATRRLTGALTKHQKTCNSTHLSSVVSQFNGELVIHIFHVARHVSW